jgi:hypothetical protein
MTQNLLSEAAQLSSFKMDITNIKIYMLIVMLVFIVCYLSFSISNKWYATDFPVFYYAASTIIDPDAPIEAIYRYDVDLYNKYNIPGENPPGLDFIYSLLAAYIMSPLALMPYYTAKTVMITINFFAYLGGVTIALRLGGAKGLTQINLLVLSCFWMPFIHNLKAGQVNAVLFFLISLAVLAATRNRPYLCGILLGITALFKIFPIAIALVLGLKNWRILIACSVVFGSSFLVPGSLEWFSVIGNIYQGNYTPVYLWLKQYSYIWFICYVFCIAGLTALIVYFSKKANYSFLASFAIPAMFLTLPLIEYYHLTMLMFSYAYLLVTTIKLKKVLLIPIILSIILICSFYIFHDHLFNVIGLLLLWTTLVFQQFFTIFEDEKNTT